MNEHKLFEAIRQVGITSEDFSLLGKTRGGQCQVYQVLCVKGNLCGKGNEKLAIRVPSRMDEQGMIAALKVEMDNLQVVATKGFQWAPKCYGCSLTFDNPIKLPFLVLEWKDGSVLHWTSSSPQGDERRRVLSQLASIHFALVSCTFEVGQ